jgi:adsorption protein B
VEPASAWLQWLVEGAGHELMLFASVGILLIGIDDLLFDLLWFARPRAPAAMPDTESGPLTGLIAVFIPAWEEAPVLAATLGRMLAAWAGEDVRLYVGCYPNDIATLFSVSPLIARNPRLRLVVGETEGPTTKGDNLNRMWAALGDDERAEGRRVAAVVLHDAEDHVHSGELALYRRYLGEHAMVQIPVVPMVTSGSRWIGGHYGDEFAEAHGKELALRSRLGVPIPSAGVGCALTRNALALLAIERGGQPFRADSLTEDYEVGMLIGAYGLRACFVDSVTAAGERIVSRGGFPGTVEHAVRQKSRWIAGIALSGWDHLGWLGARFVRGETSPWRIWLARWMLWRDRRSPLAALVLLAAYLGLFATGLKLAGTVLLHWEIAPLGAGMRLLLAVNAVLLLWRLAMRVHFTARWYGMRAALLAVPRAFIANVIAMLAARRAVLLYLRMLRSGQVLWEKTEHWDGDAAPARRAIGS